MPNSVLCPRMPAHAARTAQAGESNTLRTEFSAPRPAHEHPARPRTAQSRQGGAQARQGKLQGRQGAAPARQGAAQRRQGTPPARQGESPAWQGAAQAWQGESPARQGAAAARPGSPPARQGARPCRHADLLVKPTTPHGKPDSPRTRDAAPRVHLGTHSRRGARGRGPLLARPDAVGRGFRGVADPRGGGRELSCRGGLPPSPATPPAERPAQRVPQYGVLAMPREGDRVTRQAQSGLLRQ